MIQCSWKGGNGCPGGRPREKGQRRSRNRSRNTSPSNEVSLHLLIVLIQNLISPQWKAVQHRYVHNGMQVVQWVPQQNHSNRTCEWLWNHKREGQGSTEGSLCEYCILYVNSWYVTIAISILPCHKGMRSTTNYDNCFPIGDPTWAIHIVRKGKCCTTWTKENQF